MQPSCKVAHRQRGTSLIEMMIAILVLAVGLVGSMALASVALSTNTRNRQSSTSAAVAEMVIGQISTIPMGGSVSSVTVTDCAGNSSTINTSGTSGGSGATLTSTGKVDYAQGFSSVTSGYAMRYAVCDVTNSITATYDVRWNIKKLPSSKAEYVVVAAQFANTEGGSAQINAGAVNLRTVVGNDGN
ncbi:MAG TPA: type II secretion system protein [Candidatus Acidoferrales bacterium]|nr:type II secretion system protein [Candidatus Acidoferrales bacterium]